MAAEKLERPASSTETDWEKRIYQRYRNRCANCGNTERLRVKMVVPLEAGGHMSDSNGVLLCRSCEMAADAVKGRSKAGDQRLVNFWVSRRLFERIQEGLKTYKAFNSMGTLVRYLICKYIEDEARFDDLELYQDEGADTKLNVWVDRKHYDTFKVLLDKRGVTVTDTLKSLIRMYEEQSEINIERRTPVGEA